MRVVLSSFGQTIGRHLVHKKKRKKERESGKRRGSAFTIEVVAFSTFSPSYFFLSLSLCLSVFLLFMCVFSLDYFFIRRSLCAVGADAGLCLLDKVDVLCLLVFLSSFSSLVSPLFSTPRTDRILAFFPSETQWVCPI